MKVGASYYPELHDGGAWAADLEKGRSIGLSVLRCGEFAWDYLEPRDGDFRLEWVFAFLDLARSMGYDVIWCTPSAAPPPRFFRRWPDLNATNASGAAVPVGVRRNYTPNHPRYRERCVDMAARLGGALKDHPAVVGWQIDNELAGDGFSCWGGRWTEEGFRKYLAGRFASPAELNVALGGGVWGENYGDWAEVPIPGPMSAGAYPPGLRLEFQRYRSEMWYDFYRAQYRALKDAGARQPVTTNFFNLSWNIPFDLYRWRNELDSVGLSHYHENDNETAFQFSLMRNVGGNRKRLWVLEQKAGQQRGQNLFPESTRQRLSSHLCRCRAAGVEYAVYWHLRQHTHGCEMEHGAVLGHDGRIGRIGELIRRAIADSADTPARERSRVGLLFDFEQYWAQDLRPGHIRWDYRVELENQAFAALRTCFGEVELPGRAEIGEGWRILAAPHFQMDLGITEQLLEAAEAGTTVVLTADYGRLDAFNAVRPLPLLDALRPTLPIPDLEMIQLREGAEFLSKDNLSGRIFYAAPFGSTQIESRTFPSHLLFDHGKGRVIVLLSAFAKNDLVQLLTRTIYS